jgi:hypothetical protein
VITTAELQRYLLFSLRDSYGQEFHHRLSFLSETVPDLVAYADVYASRLHACVDCAVEQCQVIIEMKATDTLAAAPTSDVREHVTLLLANDQGEFGQVVVPAINPALLLTTGPYAGMALDPTHPDVIAYVTALQAHCNDVGHMHVSLAESLRQQSRQVR